MTEKRYSIKTVGSVTTVRRLDKTRLPGPPGKPAWPEWNEVKHLYDQIPSLNRHKAAKRKQPKRKRRKP